MSNHRNANTNTSPNANSSPNPSPNSNPNSNPNSSASSSDTKSRELKSIKKEVLVVVRENQRLQSELKTKAETITTLINQNFSELKTLQEDHERIIASITKTYDSNIKALVTSNDLFMKSFNKKLKLSVKSHCRLNTMRIGVLSEHNETLESQFSLMKTSLSNAISDLSKFKSQFDELTLKHSTATQTLSNLNAKNALLENTMSEFNAKYKAQVSSNSELSILVANLTETKTTLTRNLASAEELISHLKTDSSQKRTEIETLSKINTDLQNRYNLLSNSSSNKQSQIDDKTFEIISLNSKVNELEKINTILEEARTEFIVKNKEFSLTIDKLHSEVISYQKQVSTLTLERDRNMDEKYEAIREIESHKLKLQDFEMGVLERIKSIQDGAASRLEKANAESEIRIKDLVDKYEKKLAIIRNEFNTSISEKDQAIEGLSSHIRSYTDNQHHLFSEMDKYKTLNDKLKYESVNVEKRISDERSACRKEIEDLKSNQKREIDVLVETYDETIRGSQEFSDALEIRLNQTLEALNLSKSTINNLKNDNMALESQVSARETEDESNSSNLDNLKRENHLLTEKLERSIELNNAYDNKEKQLESQLKNLQTRYSQLLALYKKNQSLNWT